MILNLEWNLCLILLRVDLTPTEVNLTSFSGIIKNVSVWSYYFLGEKEMLLNPKLRLKPLPNPTDRRSNSL